MPPREQRYNLHELEAIAAHQLTEFRARLPRHGFELPPMPPVPIEYMAMTLTEFSVRSVPNLRVADRKLAGLLDPANEEILYEAADVPGRQNFSIAHEVGHYFLHYLPQKEKAEMPSLFSREELDATSTSREPLRFFRCSDDEVKVQENQEQLVSPDESQSSKDTSLKGAMEDPDRRAKLAKILRWQAQRNRHEWEANVFAGALLMPSDLVRWLKTKHGGDLRRMAAELNVSQQALQYRLDRLKESYEKYPSFLPKSSNSSSQQGTLF